MCWRAGVAYVTRLTTDITDTTDTTETTMPLTDAEQQLITQTEALARDQVAPHAARWERERRIGHEALAGAVALGLTRLQVPTSHGGLGFSFACKVRMTEVLAAADFGFAMSLVNTHNVAVVLARQAAPAVAARHLADLMAGRVLGCTALSEPGVGSDFGAITTRATRTPDGWRIDGAKAWITNAAEAGVIVLYAQTEPGSGGRGIASFIIDASRAGFVRDPAFALGGQHSIGTGGFRLNGYMAAEDELLAPPGRAFKAALGSINGARTYIAAMCCGMVGEALRVVQAYGQQRHSFGQPMVDQAVAAIAAGEGTSPAAQLASAQAKLLSARLAERQLPALAQAMGAEGLREHHPFSRHLIGARVAGFVDGSNEMLLERIAAVLQA